MRHSFLIVIVIMIGQLSIAQDKTTSKSNSCKGQEITMDWQKVSIVNNESDLEGLIRGEELTARTTSGKFRNTNRRILKMATIEELKRNAALKGYHSILLVSQKSTGHLKGGRDGIVSSAVGIGYKYNE